MYVIMLIMEQHGTFPIILQKEKEGGYSVTNLALQGCYSEGETVEEALANIKEATLLCLEDDENSPVENESVSLHLITL
jgi:predicted RNase H-like HicB family nuclease